MPMLNIAGEKINCEPKRTFIGFVSLLSSGVVSAVGFMLISSQRWTLIDQRLAAFIILFVQWQTLGLTISKIGIENVVFAVVSSDRNKYFPPRQFVINKVLPLAGLYSLLVGFVFSPYAAIVSFSSIVLDASSLIIMADLNARGSYRITSISNLLNYPVFFLIMVSLHYVGELNLNLALVAFLSSSLLRWLWLAKKKFIPASRQEVTCAVNLGMGIQQVLNYLLFRSDQLIISFFLLTTFAVGDIGVYVYMAKFPEIISSAMVVAGTVYFPKMYIQYPFSGATIFQQMKKYRLYILTYGLLLVVVITMYRKFWNGSPIPVYVIIPFLLHALLVIFTNNVTYSMLRQEYLSRLLLNLIFSIAVGVLYFVFTLIKGIDIYALAWVVPIQLISFLILSLYTKWGKQKDLYARDVAV